MARSVRVLSFSLSSVEAVLSGVAFALAAWAAVVSGGGWSHPRLYLRDGRRQALRKASRVPKMLPLSFLSFASFWVSFPFVSSASACSIVVSRCRGVDIIISYPAGIVKCGKATIDQGWKAINIPYIHPRTAYMYGAISCVAVA